MGSLISAIDRWDKKKRTVRDRYESMAKKKKEDAPVVDTTTEVITDRYAIYQNDCMNVIPKLGKNSVHLSVYSPPFAGLYNYSSADEDMSNCKDYDEFMEHYEFLVTELERVTIPGRWSVVHCMDVPQRGELTDFPGDIIRLHKKHGFKYHDRHSIWKEPLRVAIRTRSLGLMHKQVVKDSTLCRTALQDYMLIFRKYGTNPEPVAHPEGLSYYAGGNPVPPELIEKYKDWKDPKTNKLSHWIFQQYASGNWMDIRNNRVLNYKQARDPEDEKHVHPLQLDAIERVVLMGTNPGDIVLTPYMGVGSEVYGAVRNGRRGIGIELKASYFRQSVKNIARVDLDKQEETGIYALEFDEEEVPEESFEPIEETA